MIEFIMNNWKILGGVTVPALAFFGGYRLQVAKTKGAELENISKVRATEKALVDDMHSQILRLVQINSDLEAIVQAQAKKLRACTVECGKFLNR